MMIRHIIVRILILALLLTIALILANTMLDPNRYCGTGDGLAYLFTLSIAYIVWTFGVWVEAIFLSKSKQKKTKIWNFILPILTLGVIVIFLFINP